MFRSTLSVELAMFPMDGQDSGLVSGNNTLGPILDLDELNLEIDDMLWLNTLAAETLV
jgi:hypothetical protein